MFKNRIKIMVLTSNYPPDVSAGAFRTLALVQELNKSHAVSEIHVYTTCPNRYGSALTSPSYLKPEAKVKIIAVDVLPHKDKMHRKIIGFIQFFFGVLYQSKRMRYDIVYATSSKLMTAFLGCLIANMKDALLYVDIRDLFADSCKSLFPKGTKFTLYYFLRLVESYVFNRADGLNVVSAGFIPYVKSLRKNHNLFCFTNGIDEIFAHQPKSQKKIKYEITRNLTYAGNIGDGQGLETIVPDVAKMLGENVKLCIVGDGARKKGLAECLERVGVKNVTLQPPMDRASLLSLYRCADILFLHLNSFEAFEKVLPSKIFEYAATGKPILAGVSGYAREFLKTELDGVFVFDPGDAVGMVEAFHGAVGGAVGYDRSEFCSKYNREKIMTQMSQSIILLSGEEDTCRRIPY